MKTTVFCPPGLERGAFALGALDYLGEEKFPINRLIGASAGLLPVIFSAAGATAEGIEEFCNFNLKPLAIPFEVKEGKSDTYPPSRFTSDGWREFFGGIEKRPGLFSRIKDSSVRVELLACDPALDTRIVLVPKEASSREEFMEMLLASSALSPLWPPVNGLVDGLFAPVYFFDEVMQNPEEQFLICRGDPSSLELETGRRLKNFVSINMRLMDLLCAHQLNNEISRLGELGILGRRAFVLSHHKPLKRVNIFRRSRECVLENVQCGREAAQKFLESRV